jgi:hypothetical protein
LDGGAVVWSGGAGAGVGTSTAVHRNGNGHCARCLATAATALLQAAGARWGLEGFAGDMLHHNAWPSQGSPGGVLQLLQLSRQPVRRCVESMRHPSMYPWFKPRLLCRVDVVCSWDAVWVARGRGGGGVRIPRGVLGLGVSGAAGVEARLPPGLRGWRAAAGVELCVKHSAQMGVGERRC